jgi:hypothetical protein
MSEIPPRRPSVLIRDLLIFQLKLWMDGLKDLILAPLSLGAAVLDLLLPSPKGDRFYRVLKFGERYDLWLNLFGAAKAAERSPDGLFAASEPGDASFLGTLEGIGARRPSGVGDRLPRSPIIPPPSRRPDPPH